MCLVGNDVVRFEVQKDHSGSAVVEEEVEGVREPFRGLLEWPWKIQKLKRQRWWSWRGEDGLERCLKRRNSRIS